MNYTYIIRKANINDSIAIQKIMRKSFLDYQKICSSECSFDKLLKIDALDESIEDIKKDIEAKYVFIAFIDDNPVGTLRIEFKKDEAFLSRFGIVPEYRNIGIGKSLMNLVDKLLISKSIKKVSLYTASKYEALVSFYYGRGFYIESTDMKRGYIRAKMVKDYSYKL